MPSLLQVKYAYVTQRGFYPDAMDKANQDAFIVKKDVAGDPDTMFFGVFDGHGTAGTECAKFARDKVRRALPAPHFCRSADDAACTGWGRAYRAHAETGSGSKFPV